MIECVDRERSGSCVCRIDRTAGLGVERRRSSAGGPRRGNLAISSRMPGRTSFGREADAYVQGLRTQRRPRSSNSEFPTSGSWAGTASQQGRRCRRLERPNAPTRTGVRAWVNSGEAVRDGRLGSGTRSRCRPPCCSRHAAAAAAASIRRAAGLRPLRPRPPPRHRRPRQRQHRLRRRRATPPSTGRRARPFSRRRRTPTIAG